MSRPASSDGRASTYQSRDPSSIASREKYFFTQWHKKCSTLTFQITTANGMEQQESGFYTLCLSEKENCFPFK